MALAFQSPRFAGDSLLLEILNDPDTGTLKLGPGSPPESVKRLQKALFDLQWPQHVDTPITDESQFVIGTYGPVTTKAVTKFKTRYRIHFPPDAPTGFIDGFAGPRTLRLLDKQCVLFHRCDAALQQKADEVFEAQGIRHDSPTTPSLGWNGALRVQTGAVPVTSGLWFKPDLGAFQVARPFLKAYVVDDDGENGLLGWPFTDAITGGDGLTRQEFQGGQMLLEDDVVNVLPSSPPAIEFADPTF